MAIACSLAPLQAASFTFVTFDYPGSTETILHGINNSGQTVGSFFTATSYLQGFIRNADGSLVPIAFPFPSTDSPASSINSSGQVAGTTFYAGTFAAQGYLRSTAGTYSIVDDPMNPSNSGDFGINDSGVIVGGYGDPVNSLFEHGFLRDTAGNFTTIDDPNGNPGSTTVTGINNLGMIVGTYFAGAGSHGFLRSAAGVFTTIDDPSGNPGSTTVTGINNLGMMVGTFQDSFGYHSFIRSADGSTFLTIDYPGGSRTSISGTNDSGDIVGSYYNASTAGMQLGFIGTPVTIPEPASFALCLASLTTFAWVRRRASKPGGRPLARSSTPCGPASHASSAALCPPSVRSA